MFHLSPCAVQLGAFASAACRAASPKWFSRLPSRSTSPRDSTLAFVSLGDWGCGAHNCESKLDPMHQTAGDTQLAVSNHMAESAFAVGSSFVLALGDNFYFKGVQSIKDPLFQVRSWMS